MQQRKYKADGKSSLSLMSMIRTRRSMPVSVAAKAAGMRGELGERMTDSKVSLSVRSSQEALEAALSSADLDSVEHLGKGIFSADLALSSVAGLLRSDGVHRVQTKKRSAARLDHVAPDIRLTDPATGQRAVAETGSGVLVGIVDSGFDLSHPAFWDAAGNLRVERLLDQNTGTEFDNAQLTMQWGGATNPKGPGGDEGGHGTHVASIAAGSAHQGFEGIAPDATFLLVKTNFFDTDKAVSWIFSKAGTRPCVINLSLGHHWGGHDGTTLEEQLHDVLIGPGKLIVASAGNERTDGIHIGGRLVPNQVETVGFRILRQQPPNPPFAALTLWYDAQDAFEFDLVTPGGQSFAVPPIGNATTLTSAQLTIDIGRQTHNGPTAAVQTQIVFDFASPAVPTGLLNGWSIRLRCTGAAVGRIDGWFNNSGYAEFANHPLVEATRTIGLPATANQNIAVASHVSRDQWNSDDGPQQDTVVLVGRTSPFSSQGPTRDGRQKPEISAPGQYVTAALAHDSASAGWSDRAVLADRLLSIEGTSMSAPVVTGALALMLQKKGRLRPDKALEALRESARTDAHTVAVWNPSYGHGKLDIAVALARL